MTGTKTAKKLTLSVLIIVLLSICLAVTSVALIASMVSVKDNFFHTGIVKINLNDSKPIISEAEYLFEPGMTVKKDFFIENLSTDEVYYKIYFSAVSGDLAKVLQIQIKDGEEILFFGTPENMNKKLTLAADKPLKVAEKKTLTLYFHMPPDTGNYYQNAFLNFELSADAVQSKNNYNKEFE